MVELSEAKSNSVNNIKLQLEVRVQNTQFGGNLRADSQANYWAASHFPLAKSRNS